MLKGEITKKLRKLNETSFLNQSYATTKCHHTISLGVWVMKHIRFPKKGDNRKTNGSFNYHSYQRCPTNLSNTINLCQGRERERATIIMRILNTVFYFYSSFVSFRLSMSVLQRSLCTSDDSEAQIRWICNIYFVICSTRNIRKIISSFFFTP